MKPTASSGRDPAACTSTCRMPTLSTSRLCTRARYRLNRPKTSPTETAPRRSRTRSGIAGLSPPTCGGNSPQVAKDPPPEARSGGGFGAEDALESRASEVHADHALAVTVGIANVDHAALGFEIGVAPPRGVMGKGDANLEVGPHGHVKAREEGGAAPAKIFAGGFFFEDHTALIAAAHAERKTYGNPTFRALFCNRRAAQGDHGLGSSILAFTRMARTWASPCASPMRSAS